MAKRNSYNDLGLRYRLDSQDIVGKSRAVPSNDDEAPEGSALSQMRRLLQGDSHVSCVPPAEELVTTGAIGRVLRAQKHV